MPEIKQGLNLGDLLKYEAPNLDSRDRVTVAAAARQIALAEAQDVATREMTKAGYIK